MSSTDRGQCACVPAQRANVAGLASFYLPLVALAWRLASVPGLPREDLHYALIVRGNKTLKVGESARNETLAGKAWNRG